MKTEILHLKLFITFLLLFCSYGQNPCNQYSSHALYLIQSYMIQLLFS